MPDADLCALAAASYALAPAGTIIDWRDCRAVVTGTTATIRGTVPDSWPNWVRDFRVGGLISRFHPQIGACPAGALDAAEALAALLPAGVDTLNGHSLGGQVAVEIAGLLVAAGQPVRTLVTWDAPKAGGAALTSVLKPVPVRQYRFLGSFVTDWPVFLDRHVRAPLIVIGHPTPDPVKAHSITRALAWLLANEPPSAASDPTLPSA